MRRKARHGAIHQIACHGDDDDSAWPNGPERKERTFDGLGLVTCECDRDGCTSNLSRCEQHRTASGLQLQAICAGGKVSGDGAYEYQGVVVFADGHCVLEKR